MAASDILNTIVRLAQLLGQNVPTLIGAIKPLLSEGQQEELQAQLDASDHRADDADERAEKALQEGAKPIEP